MMANLSLAAPEAGRPRPRRSKRSGRSPKDYAIYGRRRGRGWRPLGTVPTWPAAAARRDELRAAGWQVKIVSVPQNQAGGSYSDWPELAAVLDAVDEAGVDLDGVLGQVGKLRIGAPFELVQGEADRWERIATKADARQRAEGRATYADVYAVLMAGARRAQRANDTKSANLIARAAGKVRKDAGKGGLQAQVQQLGAAAWKALKEVVAHSPSARILKAAAVPLGGPGRRGLAAIAELLAEGAKGGADALSRGSTAFIVGGIAVVALIGTGAAIVALK